MNKELKKILKVARVFEVKKMTKRNASEEEKTGLKGIPLEHISFWILTEKILAPIWEEKIVSAAAAGSGADATAKMADGDLPGSLDTFVRDHLKPALKVSIEAATPASDSFLKYSEILLKKNAVQTFVQSCKTRNADYWKERINLKKSDRMIMKRKLEKIKSAKASALSTKLANNSSSIPTHEDQDFNDDSNDDPFDDDLLKKKNRMGQRARQKKWEQTYGQNANHVKKVQQSHHQEKESVAKPSSGFIPDEDLHPSWKSKKQQKQSIQPFAGTKITFD